MEKYILIYFAVVSLITVIVTVYDKRAAKKYPQNRIPEKVLFILAFLGGSVAELFTMLKIRHKTKHKSFMIGLPAIIVLQVAVVGFLVYRYMM
ncbi:MAG: DUF1294 domain-containing protein [Clostridia bacterium]|nr:DUF1294 domain-containing protein [Clostridia bacterium]